MKTFNVQDAYNRNDFKRFLQDFLTEDFVPNEEELYFDFKNIAKGYDLGESDDMDLSVFEFIVNSSHDPRVTITKEVVALMKKYNSKSNALVAFYYPNSDQWRLSLITTDVEIKNGKISYLYSNPHRYSFLLGKDCKKHTPETMLFAKGPIKQRSENGKELNYTQDLISRFSLEVVNKEFYAQIYRLFEQLVSTDLKHPKASDNNQIKEHFAVRLIGRLIFCWFLKKKTRKDNSSLIPEELLSLKALDGTTSYYHDKLEPLFFETLNKKRDVRIEKCATGLFKDIPFLNGGLFEPHDDDCYELGEFDQSRYFNTLTIPNKWFHDLFEVFETYNFTIDENTSVDMDLSVDPEILGRIFENLLASINPETQQSARNMTGSFYTPREIVDYMVTTSLRTYLKDKTDLNDQILDELFDVTKTPELTKQQKLDIFKSLTILKALDPAVGSGAFPMGLLQKIMFILNEIDPDGKIYEEINLIPNTSLLQRNYGNKYKIIRDCIFGVDIQEMAIEIARLRFFLTLIVDEEADNPQPLPNLDFKFACANTLISLPEAEDDLFSRANLIESLKNLRKEFFSTSAERKEQIKAEFRRIQELMSFQTFNAKQTALFNGEIEQYKKNKSVQLELNDLLSDTYWNPFINKSTPWFDPMWMFGVEDGFDIVIANPPYIALQANKGVLGKMYKPYNFKTFNSMGDIYCLFYEKGMELLKQGGILTYITSNKWMRAGYGEELRLFLSKYQPLYLIDLGAGVFENATVDTNILVMKKGTYTRPTLAHVLHGNNKQITIPTEQWLQNTFDSNSWVILSAIEQSIKAKIEKYGTPLKDWDVQINYGIKTGCNEAFIITTAKREEILANCKTKDERKRTDEIIRPILRGRDIKRYKYDWKGLWLINTHNGVKGRFPRIDIKDYPAIKQWLDKGGEAYNGKIYHGYKDIEKRADKGDTPYNLRNCAYLEDFSKPKIAWADISTEPSFVEVSEKFFFNNTCYMLSPAPLYLLGILNSKLIKWFFPKIASDLGEGSRYFKQFVELLPIKKLTQGEISILENLLRKRPIDDEQVNAFVYKQYQLTAEEILFLNHL
ncbi:Eco57I restriction-modification methylase domain-containing protein [Candidatus Avelusimicrobium fimicolum]|uniref:Eco57I restriction-modification methylase domain-containing protein n=1 Tax=Candidatus Avelusimicrobium fimicolum TaxID=3416216 RepID=UPI003D10AAF6